MNEELIAQISNAITVMASEIKSLKAWKSAQEERILAEEQQARETSEEFKKFIEQRQEAERKRVSDAEKLKSMMM